MTTGALACCIWEDSMKKLILIIILLISIFLNIGCNVKSNKNSISLSKEIHKISNDEIYSTFDNSVSDEQKCKLFLKILKTDGYIQGDGITRHDYNVAGINEVINGTPKNISDEISNLEIFYIADSWHCFLMYNEKIYRFETFGGYHLELCLWDYDGNGKKDLVDFHSYGSGIPYLGVDIIDLTTMKYIEVLHRNLLDEKEFSFDYKEDIIFIDGQKLTYDGERFHLIIQDKLLEHLLDKDL